MYGVGRDCPQVPTKPLKYSSRLLKAWRSDQMHAKSHNCLHNSQVTRRKCHLKVEVLALLADCPELVEVLLACSHDGVPLAGAEPEAFQDATPLLSGHTACDMGQLTNVSAHQLHHLLTDSQTGISTQLVQLPYFTKALLYVYAGCLSMCLFCCPHIRPVIAVALTATVNQRVAMPATKVTNVRNIEQAVASTPQWQDVEKPIDDSEALP